MLNNIKNVLIFAAHHDDETIGCAGTIKKLSEMGCKITVVFATDGATGIDHTRIYEKKIVSTREKESEKVKNLLGVSKTLNWRVPCQQLTYTQKLMQKALRTIRIEKPDLIITHSVIEKHSDHQSLSKIVTQAAWKASEDILPNLGETHKVQDVWCYEVVDVLGKIDYCVDITDQFKFKIQAMKLYSSQENVVTGILSFIEGLAMIRGYSIGVKYAEAFKRIAIQPVKL